MWISTIIGNVISKIQKDTILSLDFLITPDPYNEIESSTISFPVTHTQMEFLFICMYVCTIQNQFNCFDRILLIFIWKVSFFLAPILCNLNYKFEFETIYLIQIAHWSFFIFNIFYAFHYQRMGILIK